MLFLIFKLLYFVYKESHQDWIVNYRKMWFNIKFDGVYILVMAMKNQGVKFELFISSLSFGNLKLKVKIIYHLLFPHLVA